ncbi:MAG: TetR/AcrR family transcriptional regulator, partial [Candidatus Aminicenantes bacterium]|nr:TetR/AcrR family transcriptional regulator [Candidatus Aminicenantes bacterium]
GTRERKEREFETRRRLILATATDLFQKNGFAGVTLDDIASAIEFSKGTIYNHFGSKEEIYASILVEHLNILLSCLKEAARTGRNTPERLRNSMKAYVRFYREHREYFKLLFFIDLVSDHYRVPDALLKEIRTLKIACLLELQNVVREGVRSGELEGGRPDAQVSLVMWGMINGIIQLVESRQFKEEDLDRLIGLGFEIVLRGLKRKAE